MPPDRPTARRLRIAGRVALLVGVVLVAIGSWPRAYDNDRAFDPEAGVVTHRQTTETARVAGLVLCATGGLALIVAATRAGRPAALHGPPARRP